MPESWPCDEISAMVNNTHRACWKYSRLELGARGARHDAFMRC